MKPAALTSERVAPFVYRVTAPNPGPMTGPGTNSYVVGSDPCVIIDPGVDDAGHIGVLTDALPGRLVAILLTHGHPDHTGGARALGRATGAPVRAYPAPLAGVRDETLTLDAPIRDGERFTLGDVVLEALHTPGHTPDHLCFHLPESGLLLAGDTVMADVTVVIAPPDGHMSDYFATLERLRRMPIRAIAPGHGRVLDAPAAVFDAIVAHRRQREAQVCDALGPDHGRTPESIAARLYPDLDPRLRRMAAAQVEAHLIRLAELNAAQHTGSGWRATNPDDGAPPR